MKTSELSGPALDWAVYKCQGLDIRPSLNPSIEYIGYACPSTNWAQGGPIIEREFIELGHYHDKSVRIASLMQEDGWVWFGKGPTPLIAAMRCYVASKLGDDIEIPEELT